MLVLSRQRDETIMIGDEVQITIVDIRGDKVRIGISAPPHISVHRKEVYEAIQRENRLASSVQPSDLPIDPLAAGAKDASSTSSAILRTVGSISPGPPRRSLRAPTPAPAGNSNGNSAPAPVSPAMP